MTRTARSLLRLALLAVVLAVVTHTRADPDLWGHVRFGQDTIRAGALSSIDPYSFVSDRPWINHEWAAEITMYAAYAAGGGAGLILLKVALVLAMLAFIAGSLPASVPARSKDLLVGLALIGTVPQASHIRPQLFSLTLFAMLLSVLVSPRWAGRRSSRTLLLAIIMAVWANVHGGWIVGALTLAVWGAGEQLRRQSASDRAWAVVGALAPVVATLANPYGWRLWAFLLETVGFGRDQITDWQPIVALGPAYVAIWALVLTAAGAACLRSHRRVPIDRGRLAVIAMLACGSFQVNRLLGFFAIAVTVLLGPALVFASSVEAAPTTAPRRMSVALAVAVMIGALLLSGGSAIAWSNVRCIKMDAAMFPEPAVTALADARSLHGRMLTWFDWGEYAIWHFAPRLTVSLDGRRETVYSDAAVERQFRFYVAPEDRQSTVDALQPDYIWLPARLEVTRALQNDGWNVLYAGSQSVLLGKTGSAPVHVPSPDPATPRCFPGP